MKLPAFDANGTPYQRFACEQCGYVTALPSEPGEELRPWCLHSGSYSWHGLPSRAVDLGWTQMKLIDPRTDFILEDGA